MNLRIPLQPKQGLLDWLYENSVASWFGYGGSRGGGKSGACRRVQIRRRLEYPGTAGQILRRVWDDVKKNHIEKMWDDFPELRGFWKAGDKAIAFPNGSILYFDAAENAIDVERKAFGPEFMDISVDQAEQFTEKELKQLKTTCRWPGMPDHKCKFGLFFNPGGVGAGFLQRVFHNKEFHEREVSDDFAFLQAYGWDNVEWCRAALEQDGLTADDFYSWPDQKRYRYFITRSQYGQELNRLDASMRPGQLLGDFTRFAGQYFSNWNRDEHVIPADLAERYIYRPGTRRWGSLDWGYSHHSVFQMHAQVAVKGENGNERPLIVTYREYVRNKLSERALAEEIVATVAGDELEAIYAGHDLWAKDTAGPTKEQQISRVLIAAGLPPLKKAFIGRVDGWRYMHTKLDEGEWVVSDACPDLIAAMPIAIFDEKKNNEDILDTKDMPADCRDAARYGVNEERQPGELPWEQKLQQAVQHLEDRTARNIQLNRLIADRDKERKYAGAVNNRSGARARRW